MKSKKRGMFVALILIFSVSAATAQKSKFSPVADYKKKEAAVEQLEKNLPALMQAADISGISIALVRGGKNQTARAVSG